MGTGVSRRRFLAASTLVALHTVLLGACAPTAAPTPTPAEKAPAPTPTPAAKPAPAAAKQVREVRFLCRNDIVTAYGAKAAIENFNKTHEIKVVLEEPAGDVATKAQAAIAADAMVWDGFSVMETPWSTVEWVKRQIIQPLDDYIAASNEPDAKKLLPGIIPVIREASKYEGKLYAIPGNVGSVALQWYWDPLRAVGVEAQPETWDAVYEVSKKLKAQFPDKIPFAPNAPTPLCDLFALMWAATKPDELLNKDTTLNIQGSGAIAALNWMKKMVKEGLMPPTTADTNANWDKQAVVMLLSYDVKGQHAQKTYGYDKADTGVNIFPKKGEINSGTPFWMNASVVFNKAKNPQGMVDFFVWWFGPSNEEAQKTLVATAAKPCYQYTYDRFVKGVKEFEWELKGIDLVAKSAPFPTNTYFRIEMNTIRPWVEKFLDPSSTLTAEEAMANAAKDRAEAIAKQKI